jgi:hypothetical protein
MNTAEKIYQNAQELPEPLALEVLHFAEFLKFKQQNIPPETKQQDLGELLKNYPVGSRSSAEIDQQIQALRDEWE